MLFLETATAVQSDPPAASPVPTEHQRHQQFLPLPNWRPREGPHFSARGVAASRASVPCVDPFIKSLPSPAGRGRGQAITRGREEVATTRDSAAARVTDRGAATRTASPRRGPTRHGDAVSTARPQRHWRNKACRAILTPCITTSLGGEHKLKVWLLCRTPATRRFLRTWWEVYGEGEGGFPQMSSARWLRRNEMKKYRSIGQSQGLPAHCALRALLRESRGREPEHVGWPTLPADAASQVQSTSPRGALSSE